MAVRRRGGAFALALALLVGAGAGGCVAKTQMGGSGPGRSVGDAAIYQECDSVCVRPGDCAKIYNDDGICPPGFYCALRFSCNPD